MEYKTQSLTKYLDDLSAKLPAPGGGSAAALNAALGASLMNMVINFTLGKPKYLAFNSELEELRSEVESLRLKFINLVDLDVVAFKTQDPRKALEVPLELARLCLPAIEISGRLVKIGNINLASDLAISALLLESAFISAVWNIRVNLKILNQKTLTRSITKEIQELGKKIKKIRKITEAGVGKIIRR